MLGARSFGSHSITGEVTPAQVYADSVRYPANTRPATVAVLETPEGNFFGRANFQDPILPEVQRVLDTVPEGIRERYHGGCAEIQCVNQAVGQNATLTESAITTAKVRGDGGPHGIPHTPCPSCEIVLRAFGVRYYEPN